MSYQNNIPQPTDALSQSQSDILNNFAAIQTLIDVDHVDFANSNQGQHNKVTFPVQGGAPSFAAGSIGLYNLAYAPTATNELFINRAAGGTNYPITASFVGSNTGWTYLPSGVLMVWGMATITAGGNRAILYSSVSNFPGFTVSASVPTVVRISSSGSNQNFVTVFSFTNTGFTAYSSSGGNSVSFGWMTIGK